MKEPGMAGDQTLAIIKPDAVAAGKLGAILAHLEREGYRIRAARLVRLTRAQAEAFYEVHRGRPFYDGLVEFMSSGPCFPMVLERENAVAAFRASIGATDPAEAAPGTIRKLYAESKGRNAVHGSDSDENAAREAAFFFSASERVELK
jgi:nucleoside-diphosphate kinase